MHALCQWAALQWACRRQLLLALLAEFASEVARRLGAFAYQSHLDLVHPAHLALRAHNAAAT
ncbi:hypothetical protein ACIREE_39320 [Streptomyces sp. NPDC102467]|uniref:hypothetical protein n=1 Tax=Streptomyces sp. NPDC102467 TaxID=3366179 RepID=UPI0037FF78AF